MLISGSLHPLGNVFNEPYKKDEIIFESTTPGTYEFTPKGNCICEVTLVGAGAGGAFNSSSNRSSAAPGSSGSGCIVRVFFKAKETYQITVGKGGNPNGGRDANTWGGVGDASKVALLGQNLVLAPGGNGGHVWWPNAAAAATPPALCSFVESNIVFSVVDILLNRQGVSGGTYTGPGGVSVIEGTEYGKGGSATNSGGGSTATAGKPGYVKIAYYSKPNNFKPNYQIVGAPRIENGIVNGFSQSSFLTLPNLFAPALNTWEVSFKFSILTLNIIQGIFVSVASAATAVSDSKGTVSAYGLQVHVGANNKLLLYLSSTGNTWNLSNALSGISTLESNVDYWIKLIFTGSEYILYLSKMGQFSGEETIEATVVTGEIIYPRYFLIGCNGSNFNQPLVGSIDLKESYIKIDDKIWWSCKK